MRTWTGIMLMAALTCSVVARAAEPEPVASAERMTRLAQRLAGDAATIAPAPPVAVEARPLPQAEPLPAPAATTSNARPLGPMARPAQNLPPPGSTGDGGGWLFSTLAALGVVIGLILLGRAVYAKLGGKVATSSSPVVEVLSRTAVAPRNHVLLLRVGQRVLIVSDSPGGMRTLGQVDDADEVAALLTTIAASKTTSVTGSFNQLLGRMHEDYDAVDTFEHGGDDAEHRSDRAQDALSGLLTRIRRVSGGGAS